MTHDNPDSSTVRRSLPEASDAAKRYTKKCAESVVSLVHSERDTFSSYCGALRSKDNHSAISHYATMLDTSDGRGLQEYARKLADTGWISYGYWGIVIGGNFMAGVVGGAAEGGIIHAIKPNGQFSLYGAAGVRVGGGAGGSFTVGLVFSTETYAHKYGMAPFGMAECDVSLGEGFGIAGFVETTGFTAHSGIKLYWEAGAELEISFSGGVCAEVPI